MLLRTLLFSTIVLFMGLWFSACQLTPVEETKFPDPFDQISDVEARSVLKQAMEAMGGLERWQHKQEIRFHKTYDLLLENGEVEAHASQDHVYAYDPEPNIQISWEEAGQAHLLQQQAGHTQQLVEGQADTSADLSRLTNTILSATFVANLPYNLLDPSADIRYAGLDTLESGESVHAVRIAYHPDSHANHSTPDIWHVFFDQQRYHLLAYQVQHADHYSYVQNLSDTIVEGFRLVKDRNSWRVDSLGNKLYLRARYAYAGYVVE
ncbi:MAG: hypothetical protein AAF399_13490 [Bacteroidota bacterium]